MISLIGFRTGRELKLMLERKKPLSVFSCSPSTELSQEKRFDAFLESGLFVKRAFCQIFFLENTIKLAQKRIMYAHKSEEWRIDAYILLLQTADEMGWNFSLERIRNPTWLLGERERFIFRISQKRARREKTQNRRITPMTRSAILAEHGLRQHLRPLMREPKIRPALTIDNDFI